MRTNGGTKQGSIGRRTALVVVTAVCATATSIGSETLAQATPPGKNGRIVYRRFLDIAKTRSALFTVNPDGTKMKQLTHPAPSVIDLEPDWSPNGARIAFERQVSAPIRVRWSSTRVSGSSTPTARDCTRSRSGRREPRGTSGRSGRPTARSSPSSAPTSAPRADADFTVNADGSGEVQVTPWTLNAGNSTDWSPDGRWLLFDVERGDGGSNLYNAHPDGTALTNLTKQAAGGRQYLSASFSPDGTEIVTARTPGTGSEGAADLVVLASNGQKPRAITKTRLWESAPDWGPRR